MRKIFVCLAIFFIGHCREATQRLVGDHKTPESGFVLAAETKLKGDFLTGEQTLYLRLKVDSPTMLRAELSAAIGVDTALALFSSDKRLLASTNDGGVGAAEEIYPIFLEAGEYFVRITGNAETAAPFTFFYRLFNAPSKVEREPNFFLENASVVESLATAGFYGPQFFFDKGNRVPERDCYVKELKGFEKKQLSLKVTAVDGVRPLLTIFDEQVKEASRHEASRDGAALETPAFAQPKGNKIFVCVSAAGAPQRTSRDYYELLFNFSDSVQSGESEPNNTAATANEITQEKLSGQIASNDVSDFFIWRNRRDYPVLLRVELETSELQLAHLAVQKEKEKPTLFEDSAPQREIAENIHLDVGESVYLNIKYRAALAKKKYKLVTYTLKLHETPFSDENELEPNDTVQAADFLLDQTQKWGFINPVGDVDYYRINMTLPGDRILRFDSKIDCRLHFEHLRSGKKIAQQDAVKSFAYRGAFAKDDWVKVQCLGQKGNPPERVYRIELAEP
ncbi:MAG: hypothetical protein JSR44_08580 [Spirochaetes bacterium]|nr:hypothetical protein [Spirochaetota bacterium]